MTIAEKLIQVNEGVEKTKSLNAELELTLYGTDTGQKSPYDEFWDDYQANGERTQYRHAFFGEGWTDKSFKPKYPFDNVLDPYGMFWKSKMTHLPTINVSNSTIKMYAMFDECYDLVEIEKLIVSEKCVFDTYMFGSCKKLERITIEGVIASDPVRFVASTKLSKESIISVINALSSTTSGLTVTFTKTAVNNAFTTEEWNTLTATKQNWTFALA